MIDSRFKDADGFSERLAAAAIDTIKKRVWQ